MFGKFKGWHAGLSGVRKGALWTTVGFFTLLAIGTANPAPETINVNSASQTQSDENEPVIKKKTVTETAAIAFTSTTVEDSSLEKDKMALRTAGVDGVKTLTYEVTYADGRETDKKLIKETVTTAPVTQVTAIGTKSPYVAPQPASNCDSNYTPCVPNVSYDLDCPDIGFQVTVIGNDHHGFDGNDNDGQGCESY